MPPKKKSDQKPSGAAAASDSAEPVGTEAEIETCSIADVMFELKAQRGEFTAIRGRLDAIDRGLENVCAQMTAMQQVITATGEELEVQKGRMDEAEQRISDLEDSLRAAEKTIKEAVKEISSLQYKTDSLENRGRRKNAILYNLPEKAEDGPGIFKYIQQKLPEWLHLSLDGPLELERVHRALRSADPDPEKPPKPRPVYIRFLRYTDKEMVVEAAKKKSPFGEGQVELSIRQDLSAEVRKKRKEFNAVVEVLLKKGMFRGFAFPSRLRVLHQNKITFYETPQAAETFLETFLEALAESDS